MLLIRSLVLLIAVGLALGEVVNFKQCRDYTGNCVVHEVRIDPCPQAAENKACRIKRRKPASISFDFTPGFDSENATSSVFWARETEDLELEDMDHNSCNYSTCPYKSDQKNTLSFELPIRSKFPLNDYEIKWRLKGGAGDECCFTTSIKIVR
ncbi:MD-2-related lipid-recognition protein-like [Episyrphus balteatus]|uniref:MD-2-related lipid-recognition protein-like n=1 Tax=Episyrphus balteatus TaxID=286459 RepID=UPI0024867AB6|nr:MD-2-related lipid-recognition protein-like [Episyrphus balteatus]